MPYYDSINLYENLTSSNWYDAVGISGLSIIKLITWRDNIN